MKKLLLVSSAMQHVKVFNLGDAAGIAAYVLDLARSGGVHALVTFSLIDAPAEVDEQTTVAEDLRTVVPGLVGIEPAPLSDDTESTP